VHCELGSLLDGVAICKLAKSANGFCFKVQFTKPPSGFC